MMMMNQKFISAIGYAKNWGLTYQLLLLLLLSLHFLLPPQLQHFPVRIRMPCRHESWARCGSVFRHQPAWLITDATSITQRLWAHRPSPPLRSLLRRTMEAFPSRSFLTSLSFLRMCRFRSFWLSAAEWVVRSGGVVSVGRWIRRRKVKKARGPVAGGSAGTLATGFSGNRHVRGENMGRRRIVTVGNGNVGGCGRWRVGYCGGGCRSRFRICGRRYNLEVLQFVAWEWFLHKIR